MAADRLVRLFVGADLAITDLELIDLFLLRVGQREGVLAVGLGREFVATALAAARAAIGTAGRDAFRRRSVWRRRLRRRWYITGISGYGGQCLELSAYPLKGM